MGIFFHFGAIGVMIRPFDQPRSLVMIVLAAAMMMAAAAPQAPAAERRAFGACLQKFIHDRLSDKLDAAKFKTGAQTACAAQEAAFRTAWINFDVAMRTKRSEAEENASQQIEDYLQNTTEDYVGDTTPEAPKPAKGTPPVTPASSTTPPKT
jgi:hypothetical protein